MKNKYKEFFRFCVVGGICTLIDAVIFYYFRQFLPYQISLICGYVISLFVNYVLTIYWTFQSRPTKANAIGIISAHLFNLFVVRIGLMYVFSEIFKIEDKISYMPTLFISVVINFLIIKLIVNKLW